MAAVKSSAVADQEPISVLFALQKNFDLLTLAGPLQVFTQATHDVNDDSSRAFEVTIAGAEASLLSSQGLVIQSQLSFKEAHQRLEDFDVLVIVGGNTQQVLEKDAEPLGLINNFGELQKKDPARERTVLAICTGSLLLAKEGLLCGLAATTHPDFVVKFEKLCSDAAVKYLTERTDVVEDTRYVVNNLRFDLGDEEGNPYICRKADAGRRSSNARKGSMSWKASNSRRESIARRAGMRLGGLRVITSGGGSAGIDAALYLVSAMVDEPSANKVAETMQWQWTKGIVVDGLDV